MTAPGVGDAATGGGGESASTSTVRVLVEARPVGAGGDVVDRIGRDLGRVDDDVAHQRAVEEGFDAEVEVGFRAQNEAV